MTETYRCARCSAFIRVAKAPPGRVPICGHCKRGSIPAARHKR